MNIKRTLLVGAVAAAVGVGGLGTAGIASAATSDSSSSNSIVDKLASKFNLNKSDVQAVFDQNRQEKQAERQNEQKQKLADAVTNKKLTQAQADHITQVMNEIQTLRGTGGPKSESDATRTQIKTKLDDLRKWATDNKVDTQYIMMGHGHHGGPHEEKGPETDDDTTSTQSGTNS